MEISYQQKYLKYKKKYLSLKKNLIKYNKHGGDEKKILIKWFNGIDFICKKGELEGIKESKTEVKDHKNDQNCTVNIRVESLFKSLVEALEKGGYKHNGKYVKDNVYTIVDDKRFDICSRAQEIYATKYSKHYPSVNDIKNKLDNSGIQTIIIDLYRDVLDREPLDDKKILEKMLIDLGYVDYVDPNILLNNMNLGNVQENPLLKK